MTEVVAIVDDDEPLDFAADYDADLVYAKYWRPALEQLAAWDPAAA